MDLSHLSFLLPSRAVVILTDDGVCVHKISGTKSEYIDTIPWRVQDFEDRLSDLISGTGAASVLILNDAVEQHYRKEKIVVLTSFDKVNIIKRRLNVAFPNYPMRAAIELKEATALAKERAQASGEKDKKKDGGSIYLFAASPSTETFSRVIRSIAKTDCGLSGYGLLPIESADMLKALSSKLAKRWQGMTASAWTILVGQHKGGGLRQIVVRGNELALTRVTPVDEPQDGQEDVWASDVSTELQATLSYLSRFGYVPEDGLNIIVLGDKKFSDVLDGMINVPSNFAALSPYEAGELLGVKLSPDGGAHFSDGLHAGWVAKKLSLTLPLSSKEIMDIAGPRKMASVAMIILTLAVGGVLYLASDEVQGYYQNTVNLDVAQTQLVEIDRLYKEEVERKEKMGIDINLINAALDVDKRIQSQHVDMLGILKEIGRDLIDLRIDSLEFQNSGDPLAIVPPGTPKAPVRAATLKLKFSFAGNINPKDGNKEMVDLVDRLNLHLGPLGYKAGIAEMLQNLTFRGAVDREVGLTANQKASNERYNSEILIQKVENAENSGK